MKASGTSSKTTTRSSRAPLTPPRPDRFHLAGPTVPLDPRTHAYRRDIADVALAGQLFAPHYAEAEARSASRRTMMLAEPDLGSRAVSELLLGEPFCLLDSAGDWAWGYSTLDGYVGYLSADALAPPSEPAFVVSARSALLFPEPDIKSPVLAEWPMGTRFSGRVEGAFLDTGGGHVHSRHASRLSDVPFDPVAIAESLLGTPYRWGGRSGAGIDCSGLVQLALQLAGHGAVPRDTDLQREALGRPLAADEPLRRGDLVFFPGHVGLMADGERLVHANAHWMVVTVEPLTEVIARLEPAHAEPVIARKRLA